MNRPPVWLGGFSYSRQVSSRLRPFFWPLVVIAFAICAFALLRYKRPELVDFAVPRTAAFRALAAEPLYRPEDGHYQYKYLPAFALAMAPFTWPPKATAEFLWFGLMVAMAWAFVRLSLRALPDRRSPESRLVWLTLLVTGKFFVKELAFGQFNLPLALLLMGAVIAAGRGRALVAGLLVALGVFVKPYALVLVPRLLVAAGWTPLLSFVAVTMAGLAVPSVVYGWQGNLALLHDWYRTVTETTAPNLMTFENISFASMWARWTHPGPLASTLAAFTSAAAVATGLALVRKRGGIREPHYLEAAFFFVLIPLLSPQGWDYVLLLALPAYMCLVDRFAELGRGWRMIVLTGFVLTSFAIYDLLRRALYFHVMELAGGSAGAILIALSLVRLRSKRLA